MHGWQNLALQIFIGVLVNAIIGILGWLGRRQLIFFKRTLGFLPSSKKNARSVLGSRMNFQEWKLFKNIFHKSLQKDLRNLIAPPQKISYPTSFNQKRMSQKKMSRRLGLNNQVNLVKIN
jgi:hypothetical protein